MLRLITLTLGLIGLAAALGLAFDRAALADDAHLSHYGNGQEKERTHFVKGRRHGNTTRWYPDGTLRAEGRFEEGKMVGQWIWNTPDGSPDPERSGTYELGKRVSM
jgi:antitoxin component YwqK of YwqJK toxin-antitoxin module